MIWYQIVRITRTTLTLSCLLVFFPAMEFHGNVVAYGKFQSSVTNLKWTLHCDENNSEQSALDAELWFRFKIACFLFAEYL